VPLVLLAATPVSKAAEVTHVCPPRVGVALTRMLWLFATARPETFGICIYSDGVSTSIPLEGRCDVNPVDRFHDGPPAGGMHECRESAPDRCRIVCSAS